MHYTGPTYRPPFEAGSLLLQVTVGCSHNKCSFCTMYRNVPFSVCPEEQVEADIDEAARLYGDATRVFLENGDAFVLSADRLARIAESIRAKLPKVETIAMYASILNIRGKTGYWYCAKILGFKKCNLVQVPIHTQFELIIRGVFNEYPLNDADFPEVQGESISVKKANEEYNSKEINLILEDTYPISEKQIPKAKRVLRTTTVSRNDGKSVGRHFSQSFIEAIINAARELPNDCTVNVFATTNPKNTVHIARRAFMLAERGNIAHLYVFQQKKSTKRSFEYKRYKIY